MRVMGGWREGGEGDTSEKNHGMSGAVASGGSASMAARSTLAGPFLLR